MFPLKLQFSKLHRFYVHPNQQINYIREIKYVNLKNERGDSSHKLVSDISAVS